MSGLDLSSSAGLAHADGNRILQALSYSGKVKMPPSGKLSSEEFGVVKTWTEMGSPVPPEISAPAKSGDRMIAGRKHWAFQPVQNATTPAVKNPAWVKSPVDRFILAKLEGQGIAPAPAADKLTLLRRVTYDLTGLPPTLDEIHTFLADNSRDAYSKVVDRLLASPRYGEHWGRHWLDVARYADSTGMDEDNLYPHAWRYRDYVINAFNADLPYDRFLTEQIAGDLLPMPAVVATGFLAIGPKPLAQQDRLQMIYDVVDEQIDTVSKSVMGLTVACARCHDHKFDPIPTKDYYGLASIFASTTSFRYQGRPGSISYMYYAPLDPPAYGRYQAQRQRTLSKRLEMEDTLSEDAGRENAILRPKVADYLIAAWNVRFQKKAVNAAAEERGLEAKAVERWVKWTFSEAGKKALRNWLDATDSTLAAVALGYRDQYAKSAAKWDDQLEKWRTRFAKDALHERDLAERPKFDAEQDPFFAAASFNGGPMELAESPRVQLLRKEWKLLEDTLPPAPAMASAVSDGVDVQQHVFVRGDLHSPGEPVEKHFVAVLGGTGPKPVSRGSGRLELAQWLTRPEHPLTARVMVNRIWQWHFGEALMRTPNNWGTTGEQPTHPELLDYLASQFVADGWSVKAMHKLLLLSNTYCMSSEATTEARDRDTGNRLWSRFNRTRMSVEQIRDSLLALDGSLNTAMGGSLMASEKGKRQKIDLDDVQRRTVYVPVRRGNIPSLLSTFDYGDATTSSEGRPRTNVAPQALFMMNSRFVVERSSGLAKNLLADSALSDLQRVEQAYLTVLTRKPNSKETDQALSYISGLENRLGGSDAHQKAWQSFCHVLLSTNEFLYLN